MRPSPFARPLPLLLLLSLFLAPGFVRAEEEAEEDAFAQAFPQPPCRGFCGAKHGVVAGVEAAMAAERTRAGGNALRDADLTPAQRERIVSEAQTAFAEAEVVTKDPSFEIQRQTGKRLRDAGLSLDSAASGLTAAEIADQRAFQQAVAARRATLVAEWTQSAKYPPSVRAANWRASSSRLLAFGNFLAAAVLVVDASLKVNELAGGRDPGYAPLISSGYDLAKHILSGKATEEPVAAPEQPAPHPVGNAETAPLVSSLMGPGASDPAATPVLEGEAPAPEPVRFAAITDVEEAEEERGGPRIEEAPVRAEDLAPLAEEPAAPEPLPLPVNPAFGSK